MFKMKTLKISNELHIILIKLKAEHGFKTINDTIEYVINMAIK